MIRILFLSVTLLLSGFFSGYKSTPQSLEQPPSYYPDQLAIYELYHGCGVKSLLDYSTWERALEGFSEIKPQNDSILTIIDYTKASTEQRMFIINLKQSKILYKTWVSHGKNTGLNMAEYFSNESRSLQSSPGFYLTAETYRGKHGYSLKLDGLEEDINDHARERAIVIHGANYVSKDFIEEYGRLGRSWGCPAVPSDLSKEIIDLIKDGSCLYIHTNHEAYLKETDY